MTLFDVIYSFLSAFMTAYFISDYFEFKNKKIYTIITTASLFIILTLSGIYKYQGLFLSIACWLCVLLFIYICTRQIRLEHIYINLLYQVFLIVNTVIWSLLKESLIILNIKNYYLLFIIVLQFIETMVLLKIKDQLSLTVDMLKWKIVGIFELILIFFVYFFGYMSLLRNISFSVLAFCIILLLVLCVMFMHIIYLINIENKENIKLHREKDQAKFNKQKYYALNNIKDEISRTEHRLYYVIFQIEQFLKDEEYSKIQEFLDDYKEVLSKHKVMFDTNNAVFDVLYSVKMNELIRHDVNINNCITISKNEFYDDLGFIHFIHDILDCFKKCQNINIYISENNGFVVLRIMRIDGFADINHLTSLLDKDKYDLNYIYNYENFDTRGLRLTFEMNKDND